MGSTHFLFVVLEILFKLVTDDPTFHGWVGKIGTTQSNSSDLIGARQSYGTIVGSHPRRRRGLNNSISAAEAE